MREIIKKPVIVVGLFLLVASLVFLLGYVTDLPYFRDSELGWIWTTMILWDRDIIFGYFHDF